VGLVLLTHPRPDVFNGDDFDLGRGSWRERLRAVVRLLDARDGTEAGAGGAGAVCRRRGRGAAPPRPGEGARL